MDCRKYSSFIMLVAICGCGGGGGGGGGSTPPAPPPPTTSTIELSGQVQKGPFASGGSIIVSSISSNGQQAGQLASSSILDDLGTYNVDVTPGQIALIQADGRFLDESTGAETASPIELAAIVQINASTTQTANVNLLTHLAVPRIRLLLSDGLSFSAAEAQARDEVLAAVADVVAAPAAGPFADIALYAASENDNASAYLVTLSAVFSERAEQIAEQYETESPNEMQGLLDMFAEDLADGTIDSRAELSLLRDATTRINPDQVTTSLVDLAASAGGTDFPGNILLYLDSDLDGEINVDDSDDDGDGVPDSSDAYPLDWACHLDVHGDGSRCSVMTLMRPDFLARAADIDSNGVVYMLDIDGQQVLRWSARRQTYGVPIDIPFGARTLAFSPDHNRIYIAFGFGELRAIDPDSEPTSTPFANISVTANNISKAGNYVVVADSTGDWHVFSSDGTRVDQQDVENSVQGLAWDDENDRLYFSALNRDMNLAYLTIDQQTGALGPVESTLFDNIFSLQRLLHLSPDGTRLVTGNGDVFDSASLTWQTSLAGAHWDSSWLDDESIVGLEIVENSNTRVTLRSTRGELIEYVELDGFPQRIINFEGRLLAITNGDQHTEVHTIMPGGDFDGDGVQNRIDAFPNDIAASQDTDRDGYPDNWTVGLNVGDSTSGLALDPYPLDSACFLPEHGDGSSCDLDLAITDIYPFIVHTDADGVVYLWEEGEQRIYRWESTNGYDNPIQFGNFNDDLLTGLEYSEEQNRLYLVYASGQVSYLNLDDPSEEHYLATVPNFGRAVNPAGDHVVVSGDRGEAVGRFEMVFDSGGNLSDTSEDLGRSFTWATWDPVRSRIYYLRTISPSNTGRLWYRTVDQSNGEVSAPIEIVAATNYPGSGPIRVSPDGEKILLISGPVYSASDLSFAEMTPPGYSDAQWQGNGNIVTVRYHDVARLLWTTIARVSIEGPVIEAARIPGRPIAIRRDGSDFRVVIESRGLFFENILGFYLYRPSNDTDGDGVDNLADAFPIDPSASVDSDADGRPDAWNPGMSGDDSATGLIIDSYPNDSACYLPEHGDGTACDIEASIPEYVPDEIAIDDTGIVYLFSRINRRVFRWDSAAEEYLNPFVLGNHPWFGSLVPSRMTYHPVHDRLYIGYGGEVTSIDPRAQTGETYFSSNFLGVGGFGNAGDHLLISEYEGGSSTAHVLYAADRTQLFRSPTSSRASESYSWDPVFERMYYFNGFSPDARMYYEIIDQSDAQISNRVFEGGVIQRQGLPPIRISNDGMSIVTGFGDLYSSDPFYWIRDFSTGFTDAHWLADGSLVTVAESSGDTLYERRDDTQTVVESASYDGVPLAVLPNADALLIVTDQGRPTFFNHQPQ